MGSGGRNGSHEAPQEAWPREFEATPLHLLCVGGSGGGSCGQEPKNWHADQGKLDRLGSPTYA